MFSIREAATKNLQQLASEFGPDWAKEHLVPQVLHHTARSELTFSCLLSLVHPAHPPVRLSASTAISGTPNAQFAALCTRLEVMHSSSGIGAVP